MNDVMELSLRAPAFMILCMLAGQPYSEKGNMTRSRTSNVRKRTSAMYPDLQEQLNIKCKGCNAESGTGMSQMVCVMSMRRVADQRVMRYEMCQAAEHLDFFDTAT